MSASAGRRGRSSSTAQPAAAATTSATATASAVPRSPSRPKKKQRGSAAAASGDDDDEDASDSPDDDDEDEEFQPSDDDEEEARPTVRRRSTAPSSASAAAAAPLRRAPSRARSTAATAAAASAAPAAAAAASSQVKRKRPSQPKRKKPASSTDDESTAAEEEEESDEEQLVSSSAGSSDEEEERQSSTMRKKRRSGAGCASTSNKDAKENEKGKEHEKKKPRGRPGRGHVPSDGPRQGDFEGEASLLAQFHRLRALYEAPTGSFFAEAFRAAEREEQDTDDAMSVEEEGEEANAGAQQERSASAADALTAQRKPPSRHVDFMLRLPQSVSQHVMSFLNPAFVARSERVCKRWHGTISSPAVWKQLTGLFFPQLVRAKDAALRQQESDEAALAALKPREDEEAKFFETPNPEGLTRWAHRWTDGRAVPVFDPAASAPLGAPAPAALPKAEDLLQASRGTFHWKHSLINRLAATCVECRAPCVSIYKLTQTRVCIPCAMHHPAGLYDVVNSGCAKGKSLLSDGDLSPLPSLTEWAEDAHKTVFYMAAMVRALRAAKFGGEEGFQRAWAEKVQQAHERLKHRQQAGITTKKRIPVIYRDGVGSSPEKTKGFFLCGRHNLATLFDKTPPKRIYEDASLE